MNYGIFDIEAERWLHFRVLGFYDGNVYKNFFSVSDFFDYIDKRKYRHWRFYAHNGGKYDDNFLYDELFERNWKMRFVPRGGRMICIYINTGTTQFSVVDSYASLPESLKKLGIAFDVKHKKSEFDFEEGVKVDAHDPELLRYLENDCVCLAEVLETYFANDFIIEPMLTIASQALNTWVLKYCPTNLYRTSDAHETAFRKYFYRGGRVDVFKGYGTVNEYDVNSLFPSVMLEEMPTGECQNTLKYQPGRIGFYEVEIENFPSLYISPLLVYQNGKSYYVNGKGTYYLSSAMIEYLRATFGVKCKVNWGLVFQSKSHLFNEYVETLYELKRTNRGNALYTVAKHLLNNLYGKFGQQRIKDSIETRTAKHKEGFSSFNDEYGLITVPRESRSQWILPYLAAWITDLARLKHFQLMNVAPREMYYCDTDSLFTTHDMKEFVGDKIGQLSFKGKWESIFLAPKSYAKRNKKEEVIHFKGFTAKHFTFEDFERALRKHKQLKSEEYRILSFNECIGKFDINGRFRKPRTKGIIDSAGNFLKRIRFGKVVKTPFLQRRILPSKTSVFDSYSLDKSEISA